MLKCPQVCQGDQRAESGRHPAGPGKVHLHRQLSSREAATYLFYFYLLPPMLRFLRNNLVHNNSLFWELYHQISKSCHRGDRLWTGRGYQRVTKEQRLSKASHSPCPSPIPTPTPRGRSPISLLALPSLINKAPVCPRHSADCWGYQNRFRSIVTVTHCQFAWHTIMCPPYPWALTSIAVK